MSEEVFRLSSIAQNFFSEVDPKGKERWMNLLETIQQKMVEEKVWFRNVPQIFTGFLEWANNQLSILTIMRPVIDAALKLQFDLNIPEKGLTYYFRRVYDDAREKYVLYSGKEDFLDFLFLFENRIKLLDRRSEVSILTQMFVNSNLELVKNSDMRYKEADVNDLYKQYLQTKIDIRGKHRLIDERREQADATRSQVEQMQRDIAAKEAKLRELEERETVAQQKKTMYESRVEPKGQDEVKNRLQYAQMIVHMLSYSDKQVTTSFNDILERIRQNVATVNHPWWLEAK